MDNAHELEALKSEKDDAHVFIEYLNRISRQRNLSEKRKLAEHVLYYMVKFNKPEDFPIFKEIGRLIESPKRERFAKGLQSLMGVKKTTEGFADRTIQKLFREYKQNAYNLSDLALRVFNNTGFDIHSSAPVAAVSGGGEGAAASAEASRPEVELPSSADLASLATASNLPKSSEAPLPPAPLAVAPRPTAAPVMPRPAGAPLGAPRPPSAPGVAPRPPSAPGVAPRPPMPPSAVRSDLGGSSTDALHEQMAKLKQRAPSEVKPTTAKPDNPFQTELAKRVRDRNRAPEAVFEGVAAPKDKSEAPLRNRVSASAGASAPTKAQHQRQAGVAAPKDESEAPLRNRVSASAGASAPTRVQPQRLFEGSMLDELNTRLEERKKRSEKSDSKSPKG